MELDKADLDILRALAADGRATVQGVADRVGLRRPSVHARLRRLEARAVVRGYHADIDPGAIGAGLVAFVFLRISHGKGRDCLQSCGRVGEALRAIPEIVEYHTLAGEHDAVAKVRVRDVGHLEQVAMRRVSAIPDVEQVRTTVVLTTHFERPPTVPPPSPGARRARRSAPRIEPG
jgi:DNA-binding Lrp family transcriptional regulator